MPKKRSVCPRYNKKLQRMSKRLKIPQSPVLGPSAAESPKNVEARAETDAIIDAIIGVDYGKPGGDETSYAIGLGPSIHLSKDGKIERSPMEWHIWDGQCMRSRNDDAIEGKFEVVNPHIDEYAPDIKRLTLDDLLPKD